MTPPDGARLCYRQLHFIDEETEAQEVGVLCSLDFTQGLQCPVFNPKALLPTDSREARGDACCHPLGLLSLFL